MHGWGDTAGPRARAYSSGSEGTALLGCCTVALGLGSASFPGLSALAVAMAIGASSRALQLEAGLAFLHSTERPGLYLGRVCM